VSPLTPVVSAGQLCGVIQSYSSSTSINVDLSVPAPSSGTGLQFVFGANDFSAFNTMLTTAPCSTVGCLVVLNSKAYGLTSGLVLPTNVAIRITGVAPGTPNTENDYINGTSLVNANTGTQLIALSQSLAAPLILATGGAAATNTAAHDTVQHLAIIGGAGFALDGGGGDGIDIFNWQGFTVEDVFVSNFSINGVEVAINPSSSYNTYVENILLSQLYSFWNGGYGVYVTGSPNVENVKVDSSIIEANGLNGIYVPGAGVQGLTISNNTIQWNNRLTASTEVYLGGYSTVQGCVLNGNYFEVSAVAGSKSTDWMNSNNTNCTDPIQFGLNYSTTNNGTANLQPTASSGTVVNYSTNRGGSISGLSAATSVTITFARTGWGHWDSCTATADNATAAPYISAISKTAFTISFGSAETGTVYYTCSGY
jgi:hypothetical protein